jgi:preprotein translocase subunit SecY
MPSHIRVWHVLIAQVLVGAAFVAILAFLIHFPNVARRPNPPPGGTGLLLFVCMSIALVGLSGLYRRVRTHPAVATAITVLLWLVTLYGFVFVWINTFGE